jgi:tartrate-resistant acid phosphatase type 5
MPILNRLFLGRRTGDTWRMTKRAWLLFGVLLAAAGFGITEFSIHRQDVKDPAAGRQLPPIPPSQADHSRPYERFFVFGDFGTGGKGQRTVAHAIVDTAKRDGLDFVILTGDNFYPKGVASVDDPLWKTRFEDLYGRLHVPFYVALGNHDYIGSPEAEIEYGSKDPDWKMPARYYAETRTLKDGTAIKIIIIDTNAIIEGHGDEQLAWLDRELDDARARWKFVVGHHPVFSHGKHGDTKILKEKLEPILERRHADVYFCGHDHTLEMLKPVDGVNYVVSGAGGGTDNAYNVQWTDASEYAATRGGFVEATVRKDDLVIGFVRPDGKTQFAQTISKSAVR